MCVHGWVGGWVGGWWVGEWGVGEWRVEGRGTSVTTGGAFPRSYLGRAGTVDRRRREAAHNEVY